MEKTERIRQLVDASPELWRGRRTHHGQRTQPSRHARLDAQLPGGGWPLGAVTEVIAARPGLGEFSLLLPALAEVAAQEQWVVLVDPPWVPYPAALQGHDVPLERLLMVRSNGAQESLWACEQALRCGRGGAVLAWPEQIAFARLRRLQLAASEHAKLAFLFRPQQALTEASPAALRLHVEAGGRHRAHIRIVKCRGNRPAEPVRIARPFSSRENHARQTGTHEAFKKQHARTPLAGHPSSAPRPGPAYPCPEPAGDGDSRQQPAGAARTDH